MARALAALILDFDGTIVDTETPWYRAWQAIYAEHGATLPVQEWGKLVGTAAGGFDPVAHLQSQVGRVLDAAALQADFRRRGLALQAEQDLRPGVRGLVDEAGAEGIPLALASSSPGAWVRQHLARFGLTDRFRAVCAAEDVPRVKPDPGLYLLALHRLAVPARLAVAVEDSPHGATAALRAGLRCVVVPNTLTRALPMPSGVRLLPSLEGVGLDGLAARAGLP